MIFVSINSWTRDDQHKDGYHNFDSGSAPTEFDLICLEKLDHTDEVTNYSLVTILLGDQKLKIRFDWKEEQEIASSDFVFIPESKTVFFRSRNQWGAIDLENKMIKRHEHSMWIACDRTERKLCVNSR